jgi:hypothetical protein
LLATPAVLVQPVEQGVAAGLERLDFNYASAGAMRFPGRLVERLGELPGDVETFACLQRIALQGGVPQRSVPDDVIAQGRWTLLHNEQEVQAVEPGWISHHLFEDGLRSPSEWLAGQAVRLAGPALLEAGSGGTVVAMAAGVLAALGMVAGGFGAITLGLMLVAAAWLGFACASLFGRFERRSLRLPRPRVAPVVTYRWIVDGVLLALLGLAHGQNGYIAGLFALLMLLGLIRLVPVLLPISNRGMDGGSSLVRPDAGSAVHAGLVAQWRSGFRGCLAFIRINNGRKTKSANASLTPCHLWWAYD